MIFDKKQVLWYNLGMNQLQMFQFQNPDMPTLDISRCKASPIGYETASNMVRTYHYAHRVPSIVISLGMYVDGVLAGCITYGIPPSPNVQRCCGEQYRKNALELNRLFIHDWAGRNSESWLVGQSFKYLKRHYPNYFILISYADTGEGHTGYVYQVTNWLYTGLHAKERCAGVKLKDGSVIHPKHLVNMFGTRSVATIKKNLGNRFSAIIPGTEKHR